MSCRWIDWCFLIVYSAEHGVDVDYKNTFNIISYFTHHFIKNISSPLLSVAPMIRSGSRFRAKPRGFSAWWGKEKKKRLHVQEIGKMCVNEWGLTSFFLASVSGSSVDFLFGADFSLMFFWASKKAEMRSGQSRFSSGSHVLSALDEQ